jgi:hypothetical protein
VTWGKSQYLDKSSLSVATISTWPSVALTNDNYVIIVFSEGQYRREGRLYYQVGKLDPTGPVDQSIGWLTKWQYYDTGFHPNISVNNNGVIAEVHEADSSTKVFYRLGHMKNPSSGEYNIVWDSGTRGIEYDRGDDPHAAINDNGDFVEMHGVPGETRLHYKRGTVSGSAISFPDPNAPFYLSAAYRPAITVTNLGRVLEVHDSGGISAAFGWLSVVRSEIVWQQPAKVYPVGSYPSLASNGDYAIATWNNSDSLFYSVTWIP